MIRVKRQVYINKEKIIDCEETYDSRQSLIDKIKDIYKSEVVVDIFNDSVITYKTDNVDYIKYVMLEETDERD